MIKEADLILTLATAHRSMIVQAEPLAFRRVFTLREFGRLGETADEFITVVDPGALRARVADVAQQRGWATPATQGADEIADPFGASLDVARTCAAQISAAVDAVSAVLGLSGSPTGNGGAGRGTRRTKRSR